MDRSAPSQGNSRERNCRIYAMNESLFGQSRAQLDDLEREMDIQLQIDFSNCYLILTGLPRRFYMERLGMGRAQLMEQLGTLQEQLSSMLENTPARYELAVLNYDYSKRLAIAISPEGELDVATFAEKVGSFIESDYQHLAPHKAPESRNITVYSEKIESYALYQRSFLQLKELYDRAFFLREYDVFGVKQAQQDQILTSMVETERELTVIVDQLFLRDLPEAETHLHTLFLEQLKHAQDRRLCAEVMVLMKRRIEDLCLILGVADTPDIASALDMDRFLCIEELHASVCSLVQRLLSKSTMPALLPDGLSIRTARLIQEHYYEELDLTIISERLHVNPSYLSHLFKRTMGVGLTQYITRIRIEQAQRLLRETDLKIAQIAKDVGLSDPRYFNTVFKRQTGMTPAVYRKQIAEQSRIN